MITPGVILQAGWFVFPSIEPRPLGFSFKTGERSLIKFSKSEVDPHILFTSRPLTIIIYALGISIFQVDCLFTFIINIFINMVIQLCRSFK